MRFVRNGNRGRFPNPWFRGQPCVSFEIERCPQNPGLGNVPGLRDLRATVAERRERGVEILLGAIDAVGSDLVWLGRIAAPSLRIANMTVAGE